MIRRVCVGESVGDNAVRLSVFVTQLYPAAAEIGVGA